MADGRQRVRCLQHGIGRSRDRGSKWQGGRRQTTPHQGAQGGAQRHPAHRSLAPCSQEPLG